MVSSIYRPEVPGGELSRPRCGGRVGPEEIVTVHAGAISVRMSASGDRGRGRVSFAYPMAHDVRSRLAADEVVVTEPGEDRPRRYRIERLTHATAAGTWEHAPPPRELTGRDLRPPRPGSPASVFGAVASDGPLPAVFEVQLPPAIVNGAAVEIPKVVFRQGDAAWISPLNC